MLKAELHTHINVDPIDTFIKYSAYDLIDDAKNKNYDVLAITCHNYFFQDEKVEQYAKKKGITLLNGIEKNINGKHTLIYNTTKEVEKVHTITQLKEFKKENPEILIIAAHPFHYDPTCHGKNVIKHLELFDAWEYSFFHSKLINPNKRGIKLSKKHNKPMVGNCDVHDLKYFGSTYSLIDSEPKKESIIKAIKENKVIVKAKPLDTFTFLKLSFKIITGKIKYLIMGRA